MTFENCLRTKVRAKLAEEGRGKDALDMFDQFDTEARLNMSPDAAARHAAEETVRVLKYQAAEKRRFMALSSAAQGRIDKNMKRYKDSSGEQNIPAAAQAVFDRDEYARYSNVTARIDEVRGTAHSLMVDVLATFRRRMTGQVRAPARLKNMVKAAFGENTDDMAARQLSDAWSDANQYLRMRFNRAGGRIANNKNWGLPQIHDPHKVRGATFEEWRADLDLDRSKMVDELTQAPITKERLELALVDVYDTIRTDGGNKITPSGRATGKAIANRHLDHRFLVFKDADAWLKYNDKFGQSDPFSTMMGYVDTMARDIGLMEVLGPNPNATKVWLEQTITKDAKLKGRTEVGDRAVSRAEKAIKNINGMYRLITGETTMPVDGLMSNVLAGTRQFLVAAQLGSAFLSALSDVSFQRQAAKYAGLRQTGVLKNLLKQFSPGRLEDKKLAVRLGLIAENWSTRAIAQSRYTGDVAFGEIGSRLSDFVLRASLLSSWTQAGRHAFGMEFMGAMADFAPKGFDELPEAFAKTLKRYGIFEQQWNQIRATKPINHSGADFFDAAALRAREDLLPGEAEDLSRRVLEMVRTETEFAVPSSSMRGRVALLGDTRPGTVQGELIRSFAMYKNFAATIYFTHIRRGLAQEGLKKKGIYLGELAIATTLMGALAIQAKQIVGGKDPRPMTDAKFWGAATVQGGGLGIFGDFLSSSENRYGGGIGQTIAGPVAGVGQDVLALTFGNISAAAQGKDPELGKDAVGFLRRYTPGGSIWYARLAYDRLILDQLQEKLDPKAMRAFRAKEKKTRRQFGQGYWWRPGKTLPDRAPELENVLEERK
ncbi:MAG: hypothetical protein L3J58_11835 [Emcibacter sp.]|nr:hypothetical protein [Emcibacter sp.]